MDRKSSPERSSPDPNADTGTLLDAAANDEQAPNMAAIVAQPNVQNMPGPIGGVNKRYRPAPAKTFQCRGYGDCRMVFSRSEHLARHIRKHTGERPFTCHCGKQFSRLDNLRQHAQTVHADKQEQNERMMRDLTSLHATMAAANKVGNPRGGRRASGVPIQQQQQQPVPLPPPNGTNNGNPNGIDAGLGMIKQEDLGMPLNHRPDGTGYDGEQSHNGGGLMYHQHQHQPTSWHVQTGPDLEPRPSSRGANGHSFRDQHQHHSFLPPSQPQSHSFLPFSSTLAFGLPGDASRSGTGSRPSTSGGGSGERLPPLSAIVSASLPAPTSSPQQQSLHQYQQQHQQQQQQYSTSSSPGSQQLLPFPTHLRPRPNTANRPSSSSSNSATSFYPNPPTSLSAKSTYYGGGAPALHYGRSYHAGDLPPPPPPASSSVGGYDVNDSASTGSSSPTGTPQDTSPFYFHPPDAAQQQQHSHARSNSPVPSALSRKRAFAGPDGPLHSYDELAGYSHPQQQQQLNSNHQGQAQSQLDYDYGSESRPQSRRLSVMELCNDSAGAEVLDPNAVFALGVNGVGANGSSYMMGRPDTASGLGLVSSASALAIFDRESRSPVSLSLQQQQGQRSPSGSHGSGGRSPREGEMLMNAGAGRISPPSRRVTPTAYSQMQPPPPPRPNSTTYPMSSTSSNSSASASASPPGLSTTPVSMTFPSQQQNPYYGMGAMGGVMGSGVYQQQPQSPTFGSQSGSTASTPVTAFAPPPPSPYGQQYQHQQHHPQHQRHPQHQHQHPHHHPGGASPQSSNAGTVSPFSPRSPPPLSPLHQQHHSHTQHYQAMQQGYAGQGGYGQDDSGYVGRAGQEAYGTA
ncbi:hypothetical protein Hypma_005688 [Hypsizygus marmoreus]|uniref:C2H2-type domain-containing protein n=1 Tax=Hypsizygus marmoreus TaxID=39966 RepID=A0A369JW16_HYPMA|nr:hypothetical protein Hypma_005688 [Hypsizygus marmoreus]